MANQQPDFNALRQHLEAAGAQFRRFSNIPPVVEAQRFDRLNNRLDSVQNGLDSVQNQTTYLFNELNGLKNQTRCLFNEINKTQNLMNDGFNQTIAQLTSLQEQNTSFLRQIHQNRITQKAREYNSITKNLNRNGITTNPRHRLLPLQNIFTGYTIHNCPRTKAEIRRLSQREVNRLLTLLDLPRQGTLNQKRLVLADTFC